MCTAMRIRAGVRAKLLGLELGPPLMNDCSRHVTTPSGMPSQMGVMQVLSNSINNDSIERVNTWRAPRTEQHGTVGTQVLTSDGMCGCFRLILCSCNTWHSVCDTTCGGGGVRDECCVAHEMW